MEVRNAKAGKASNEEEVPGALEPLLSGEIEVAKGVQFVKGEPNRGGFLFQDFEAAVLTTAHKWRTWLHATAESVYKEHNKSPQRAQLSA